MTPTPIPTSPDTKSRLATPGDDAAAVLAEGAEIGFVGDRDRDVEAEAFGEHLAERHVPPAEVRGEVHEPVGPSRHPDDRDADAGEVVVDGHDAEQRSGELDGVLDGLARARSDPVGDRCGRG